MPKHRPTSILVIGILNLVFASLGIMADLGAEVMQAAAPLFRQANQGGKDYQEKLDQFVNERAASKVVGHVGVALDLAVCVVMITSAVGLLRMQPWGRSLGLAYGVASIVSHLIGIIYGIVWLVPAFREFFQVHAPQNDQEKMLATIMQFTMVSTPIIGLIAMIYPIIVLILLLRPSVAAAFRGEAVVLKAVEPDEGRWRD